MFDEILPFKMASFYCAMLVSGRIKHKELKELTETPAGNVHDKFWKSCQVGL